MIHTYGKSSLSNISQVFIIKRIQLFETELKYISFDVTQTSPNGGCASLNLSLGIKDYSNVNLIKIDRVRQETPDRFVYLKLIYI